MVALGLIWYYQILRGPVMAYLALIGVVWFCLALLNNVLFYLAIYYFIYLFLVSLGLAWLCFTLFGNLRLRALTGSWLVLLHRHCFALFTLAWHCLLLKVSAFGIAESWLARVLLSLGWLVCLARLYFDLLGNIFTSCFLVWPLFDLCLTCIFLVLPCIALTLM